MNINPANLISIIRVAMIFVAVYFLLEVSTSQGNFIALIIISAAIVLDAVDGKVARKFGYQDEVGKLTDLYADHVVANLIWVTLAFIGVVPVWIPLIATTRDMAVDFFRQIISIQTGKNGFEQVVNLPTGWLSASRSMRFVYALLKLGVWALALTAMYFPITTIVNYLAWLTLFVCLLRAVPAFR